MALFPKLRSGSISSPRVGAIAILFLCAGYGLACQVPVFRYALERWPADSYELRVPPSMKDSPALSLLREEALCNLRVVDAPEESDAIQLYHRRQTNPYSPPIWKGPLNEESIRALLHSPARKTLVERILAGESVIWVFVPGKNAEANTGIRDILDSTLEQARATLQIPEGVVTDSDDLTLENFSGDPADIVSEDIPLKIDFSVLEIPHDSPGEAVLLSILLSIEDDLHELVDQPMVFPVFGRGRFLEPLVGKGISKANILDYSNYLCGACSCEVKAGNPGMDLLVTADWSGADEANITTLTKAAEPVPETVHIEATADSDPKGLSRRALAVGAGVVLLLVGLVVFFFRGS